MDDELLCFINEKLEEMDPGKLLNLGSDHGEESRYIPEKFETIHCDLKDTGRNHFVKSDLNKKFPFEGNIFDYVLAIEIIEHLENPWHFVREINRVLQSGGVLIISIPNLCSEQNRKLFFKKGIFDWFGPKRMKKPHHINPIMPWELEFILEENGFRTEKSFIGECLAFEARKYSRQNYSWE